MSATTKKSSRLSVATFIAFLKALIAAIQSTLTCTKAVTFNNVSTTWGAVTQVFQACVTANANVQSTKQAYSQAVAAQKTALAAAKAQVKLFTAWAIGQYGAAAYAMFGLPAPKPKTPRTATSKAASASKTKATKVAKQEALAALVPPTAEETAQAAIDSALGGGSSSPAAPASAAPAAPAAAPAVKS